MRNHRIHAGALGLAAALACAGSAYAATGPSSSDAPYVVRSMPGVVTKSILTVGDSAGGYRMAGIPDGLGAYDNGDGTFTMLSNHELRDTAGVVRDHGAKGAFVSKWTIDKQTLAVEAGQDLIQNLHLTSGSAALNRLCSADLPGLEAFFDPSSGKGYDGRIFMSGEETAGGRAFGHVATGPGAGNSWQLPALGGGEWENLVANPATGEKTVVVGTHDTSGGQLIVYTGDKQASGNAVERAGLTNGSIGAIKVDGVGLESSPQGIPSGTRFSVAAPGSGTGFLRPEDAAWDPQNPADLYFVTTNSFTAPSRLYRLSFDDPSNPAAGGKIDMLLDGSEGQRMLDNLTVTRRGDLILQEDPGNQSYLARIWRYYPAADKLVEVAHHEADLFTTAGDSYLGTQDEESSGVIDAAPILGDGWFLFDDQVHTSAGDPELVERGQYLALHVPPGQK